MVGFYKGVLVLTEMLLVFVIDFVTAVQFFKKNQDTGKDTGKDTNKDMKNNPKKFTPPFNVSRPASNPRRYKPNNNNSTNNVDNNRATEGTAQLTAPSTQSETKPLRTTPPGTTQSAPSGSNGNPLSEETNSKADFNFKRVHIVPASDTTMRVSVLNDSKNGKKIVLSSQTGEGTEIVLEPIEFNVFRLRTSVRSSKIKKSTGKNSKNDSTKDFLYICRHPSLRNNKLILCSPSSTLSDQLSVTTAQNARYANWSLLKTGTSYEIRTVERSLCLRRGAAKKSENTKKRNVQDEFQLRTRKCEDKEAYKWLIEIVKDEKELKIELPPVIKAVKKEVDRENQKEVERIEKENQNEREIDENQADGPFDEEEPPLYLPTESPSTVPTYEDILKRNVVRHVLSSAYRSYMIEG